MQLYPRLRNRTVRQLRAHVFVQISIDLLATTMMACPDGSQQDAYLRDLGNVQSFLFVDGNLIMELPFDSGGMTFAPAEQG